MSKRRTHKWVLATDEKGYCYYVCAKCGVEEVKVKEDSTLDVKYCSVKSRKK